VSNRGQHRVTTPGEGNDEGSQGARHEEERPEEVPLADREIDGGDAGVHEADGAQRGADERQRVGHDEHPEGVPPRERRRAAVGMVVGDVASREGESGAERHRRYEHGADAKSLRRVVELLRLFLLVLSSWPQDVLLLKLVPPTDAMASARTGQSTMDHLLGVLHACELKENNNNISMHI